MTPTNVEDGITNTNRIKSAIAHKPVLFYSLASLALCLLLNIGIFKDYAFTDDYEFLWSAHTLKSFKAVFIQGGRLLYGELNQFIFGTLIQTISGLKWVRLFSVLTCTLLSLQVFRLLLRLNWKVYESALFSILIFALPSIGVYTSWSITYEIPLALNCSFFAGVILLRCFETEKNRSLNYVAAIVLVVVSLFLYQSAGTAFLIPFVFSFSTTKTYSFNTLLRLLIFFGISFALYYKVFMLSLGWYGLTPLERSALNLANLPHRFIYFYTNELKMLLYGSSVLMHFNVFLILGLVSFLGFFFFMLKHVSKNTSFGVMLLFFIVILPVSYLPNLLSADNWVCSRTMAPAAIIVLYFQFYFLQQLCKINKLFRVPSVTLAVLILALGAVNVNKYFTSIQAKEYRALRAAFDKIANSKTDHVILIRPGEDFLEQSGQRYYAYSDEYGQISSSRAWVPVPFLNQVLKENSSRVLGNQLEIETYAAHESFNNPGNYTVIDLDKILKPEF